MEPETVKYKWRCILCGQEFSSDEVTPEEHLKNCPRKELAMDTAKVFPCGCILKDGGILILCPKHLKALREHGMHGIE